MLRLVTTLKCACGNRLRLVLIKRAEPTNPHGITLEDITGEPLCKLIITDGELKLIKKGPVTIAYEFVCKKCLKE